MEQLEPEKQKEVDLPKSQEEHLGSGSLEDKLSYEENLKREIEEKIKSHLRLRNVTKKEDKMNKFSELNKIAYKLSKLKNMKSKKALDLWEKFNKLNKSK